MFSVDDDLDPTGLDGDRDVRGYEWSVITTSDVVGLSPSTLNIL